jgi:hypothetical protein
MASLADQFTDKQIDEFKENRHLSTYFLVTINPPGYNFRSRS